MVESANVAGFYSEIPIAFFCGGGIITLFGETGENPVRVRRREVQCEHCSYPIAAIWGTGHWDF